MSETDEQNDLAPRQQPVQAPKAGNLKGILMWLLVAFTSGLAVYSNVMMFRAEGKAETAEKALQQAVREKATATQELAAAQAEIDTLRSGGRNAETAPTTAQPEQQPPREPESDLAGQLSDLKTRFEATSRKLDAARKRRETAESALTQLKSDFATAQEQVTALQTELEEARAQSQRSEQKAIRYRERIDRLETQLQERF